MRNLNEYDCIQYGDFYLTKDDVLNLYRLQKELLINKNIVACLESCADIWQDYSTNLSASWLFFPDKDCDIICNIESSGIIF